MTSEQNAPSHPTIPLIAKQAIEAAVGPAGVIAGDDAEPLLQEWRGRWRGAPSLIVAPGTTAETAAVVKICADHRIAITPQGGNTGLVGGQIPQHGEVLISLRRLNRIRDVAPLNNAMVIEAGATLAAAQEAAAAVDRLFPLSIGSEGSCQIGGVISTNAGGVNVLRYGNTRDLVLGLEAVTADGELWNGLKTLRKDNTGYDLKQLFIGGEGTLGIVTAAALKLFPAPREKMTVLAGLPDAAACVPLLSRAHAASGGQTTSFELISRPCLELAIKNLPDVRDPMATPHPWYALIEFSAGAEGVLAPMAEAFLSAALEAGEIDDAIIAASDAQSHALWHMRHGLSEAMRPEGAQVKHDISVPVSDIPAFLNAADAAVEAACPGARVIAFGHVGDGNIHYDVLQPLGMERAAFLRRWDAVEGGVYDVIQRFNGSISAEHGVGVARRDALVERKSPVEMALMAKVKSALDPHGIMNPGKMLRVD